MVLAGFRCITGRMNRRFSILQELPRIPTPWKQQWRRIRYQLMPVAVVCLCALWASWLWHQRGGSANGLGEVTPERIAVVAPRDGVLIHPKDRKRTHVYGNLIQPGQEVAWLKSADGAVTPITAPIGGQVVAIAHHPGEIVHDGDTILTISQVNGQHIISYIRQEQHIHPILDMPVEIKTRLPGSKFTRSRIERMGPEFEHVPARQQRDPKVSEWGIPVYIPIPEGLLLRPGELVDLKFVATAQ